MLRRSARAAFARQCRPEGAAQAGRARDRAHIQGCGEISPPQRWALQAAARAAASSARRRGAAPSSAAPAHAATQSAPLRPSRARASLCALASVQTQQQGRVCRLRRRSPPPRRSLHRAPTRSRAVRAASSTCSRRSARTGSVTREHTRSSAHADRWMDKGWGRTSAPDEASRSVLESDSTCSSRAQHAHALSTPSPRLVSPCNQTKGAGRAGAAQNSV